MVLGCILCHQPLVTLIQPKPKKKKIYSKLSKPSKPPALDPLSHIPHPFHPFQPSTSRLQLVDQNNNFPPGLPHLSFESSKYESATVNSDYEVLSSKCGHLFHRICLKTYIAARPNVAVGNKRECPFCYKPIILTQCIPTELIIPDDHLILDQLAMLLVENDTLQKQLVYLRDNVISQKQQHVKEIELEIQRIAGERKQKLDELERLHSQFHEDQFDCLQEDLEQIEEENNCLSRQGSFLMAIIEQAARIQNRVRNTPGRSKRAELANSTRILIPKKIVPKIPKKITRIPTSFHEFESQKLLKKRDVRQEKILRSPTALSTILEVEEDQPKAPVASTLLQSTVLDFRNPIAKLMTMVKAEDKGKKYSPSKMLKKYHRIESYDADEEYGDDGDEDGKVDSCSSALVSSIELRARKNKYNLFS